MKKIYALLIAVPMSVGFAACSDKNDQEPTPEFGEAADLSKTEMANCYIVQSAGEYVFKADNQFNLGPGLPVPPHIEPVSAQLVWQTVPGSIESVELIGGSSPYVRFKVAKAKGNALIAVLNQAGEIEWSWHIWMPEEEVTGVMMSSGYEVMNMNLGAMNNHAADPASYGMLYQWGRKDPFPAAETLTGTTATISAPMYDIDGNQVKLSNSSWTSMADNNLSYSIAHPTVVLSNYAHYTESRDWLSESDDSLWGNPDGDSNYLGDYPNKGKKTCYDPSPAGWRVAPADAFLHLTATGNYTWDYTEFNVLDISGDGYIGIEDYNYGWHFMVSPVVPLYFPAAARFDGSYAMLMGSMSGLWGNYWSNSPYSSIAGGALCCLSFQTQGQNGESWVTVSPHGGASRADAYSVRCIRDQK